MAVSIPRLDVTVPAEGWAQAVIEDSARCLIAETIKAKYGAGSRPVVDMNFIRMTIAPGVRALYPTPAIAKAVLVDFDEGLLPDEDVRIVARAIHVRERPSSAGQRVTVATVREWAKEQDLPVPPAGVLSSEIIDAYKAAHPKVKFVEQGKRIHARQDGHGHSSTPVTTGGESLPVSGSLAGGNLAPQVPDSRRRLFGDRKLTRAMVDRGWTPPQH